MTITEATIQTAFAKKLVDDYGYNRNSVKTEYLIQIGSYRGRADVVILNKNDWAYPEEVFFIAEIKKAGENRGAAYEQLRSYIAASLNCKYGALVIGSTIEFFVVETSNGKKILKPITTLPRAYSTDYSYGKTKDALHLTGPSEKAPVSNQRYQYLHDATEENLHRSESAFIVVCFIIVFVVFTFVSVFYAHFGLLVLVTLVLSFVIFLRTEKRVQQIEKEEKEFIAFCKDQGTEYMRKCLKGNFHWDGSITQVKDWLGENLEHPGSVEYIEWSPVTENAGNYIVRVKYRAKDSFGDYVVSNQVFTLDKDGTVTNVRDYESNR